MAIFAVLLALGIFGAQHVDHTKHSAPPVAVDAKK